jgi:hypothetical protein
MARVLSIHLQCIIHRMHIVLDSHSEQVNSRLVALLDHGDGSPGLAREYRVSYTAASARGLLRAACPGLIFPTTPHATSCR